MNFDRKCLFLNISKAGVIREKKDIRELLKRKKNSFNKGVITTSLLVNKNTFENKKKPFPYIKYKKKKQIKRKMIKYSWMKLKNTIKKELTQKEKN